MGSGIFENNRRRLKESREERLNTKIKKDNEYSIGYLNYLEQHNPERYKEVKQILNKYT